MKFLSDFSFTYQVEYGRNVPVRRATPLKRGNIDTYNVQRSTYHNGKNYSVANGLFVNGMMHKLIFC
jgi:hypothetical protein